MRMLTERGMRLAAEFSAGGVSVVEGYPGAAQDLLGIPRKGADLGGLARGLRRLGLRGDLRRPDLTHDELDAATIAWVGREHLQGRSLVIGDPTEGVMVLPGTPARRGRADPYPRARVPSARRISAKNRD
jgi:predicted nuclease with RNAse H fold